jgi:hypothetical protein
VTLLSTSGRVPSWRSVIAVARAVAGVLLGAVTAYLLLERSHAEEVGGGSRVLAEIVRGERPLSPLTWLAFAAVLLVLLLSGRDRARVPVRAARGR